MKKMLMMCGLMVALLGFMTFSAGATPITGDVSFSGGYHVNNVSLGAATAFTSFDNVIVPVSGSGTGDLAALVSGTNLTMNPFVFEPFAPPVPDWWEVDLGGTIYSFILTTRDIVFQGPTALYLTGFGIMRISSGGYTDTPGTWNLTANQQNTTLSFSGGSGSTAVPEPATLLLLGCGLIGLAGFARKKLKK